MWRISNLPAGTCRNQQTGRPRGVYTILVGGPVWSGKVATPVRSLLRQLATYTGTLAPFYTDAGTPDDYEADFASLAPQANVVPGLGLTASDLATADQPLTTWWESFK